MGDATDKWHLIFLQAVFLHHLVALLLEGDDDQGHKDIDEEEGEHNKVDDIEDGHLHAVPGAGTLVLEGGIHGVLENPLRTEVGRWGKWDKGTGTERNIKRKWTRNKSNLFSDSSYRGYFMKPKASHLLCLWGVLTTSATFTTMYWEPVMCQKRSSMVYLFSQQPS